jgi:SAM-dependent methyltransferase
MNEKTIEGKNTNHTQMREHYEIEKELASKLRNSSQQERRYLYSSLYNEMYQRVPLHPQLARKSSRKETEIAVASQLKVIENFLNQDITFLEVGPGDCAFSFEVAKFVKQVYSVDVSDEITKTVTRPPNSHLILSDGSNIPLPLNSVNVAYSNQLMEHLHPEDAFEQLQNIYNTLVPGGVYVCITPNRLNGPHDISRSFDEVATGFHLKEYTVSELSELFRKVGFSRLRVYIGAKGKYLSLPTLPFIAIETLLDKLPHSLRKIVVRNLLFSLLLEIRLVGSK